MALVLDASALAEYLVGSTLGREAAKHLDSQAGEIHVPHLAVIETASVIRAWVRKGELAIERAEQVLIDLRDLPARRWPAEFLLPRIWQLRDNLTVYDATYVALSEQLDASLLTADSRLARGVAALATCPIFVLKVSH